MDEFVTGVTLCSDVRNTSKTKQMYSFGKAKRFLDVPSSVKASKNHSIYSLPSTLSNRSTSFGYGRKLNLVELQNTNDQMKLHPPIYELSATKTSNHITNPKYSFGIAREFYKKVLINNTANAPFTISPGPGRYSPPHRFGAEGPKYSFREKTLYKGKGYRLNVPGPGQYGYVETNTKGFYPLSQFRNTSRTPWSMAKEVRFNEIGKRHRISLGPGSYDHDNLTNSTGRLYNSKYESHLGKTMTKRYKSIFDASKNYTPGPGAYDAFSEFGFYKNTNTGSFSQTPMRMRTEYGSFGNRPRLTKRGPGLNNSMLTEGNTRYSRN